MAFRFLHSADLHLDTPFEGIGKFSPQLQERLRDASLVALDNLIAAAIQHQCNFVLFAGDIYDGIIRGARAQSRLIRNLRQLDKSGIRSFLIYGNHDPIGEGWSALRKGDFPPSVTIFEQSDTVAAADVIRDDSVIATVHGISFSTQEERRNLAKLFPHSRSTSAFQIGLLHCNAGGQEGYEPYAPCSIEDLKAADIDYWALGHIHKRNILQERSPTILYPGNLQARNFKEPAAKGATLVNVDDFGAVQMIPLELDRVRFVDIDVPVGACGSLQTVYDACAAATIGAYENSAHKYLIVRILLSGATGIYGDLLAAHEQNELVDTIRENVGTEQAWVAQVVFRAIPTIDREVLRTAHGFAADLLRLVESLQADEASIKALRLRLKTQLQKTSVAQSAAGIVDGMDMNSLLAAAEGQLLTLLQGKNQE